MRCGQLALEAAIHWLTTRDGREGISLADLQAVCNWVKAAENRSLSGEDKKNWVLSRMKDFEKFANEHIRELVFQVALNWANKLGHIELKDPRPIGQIKEVK